MKRRSKNRARKVAHARAKAARAQEPETFAHVSGKDWLDARMARKIEIRATGATYTEGQEPTHACTRMNGQPQEHDLTRGMAPHGTHRQSPITGREVTLIRAWDEDRVRWYRDGIARMRRMRTVEIDGKRVTVVDGIAHGRTVVVPRARDEVRVRETLAHAHEGRAVDRRVDNTIGRNSGWCDAQDKAERAFAYETRVGGQ